MEWIHTDSLLGWWGLHVGTGAGLCSTAGARDGKIGDEDGIA